MATASEHVYHEGFPVSVNDKIPFYQRMARSRTGLVILILFGILFGGVSFVYLSWPMLFIFFSGILSHEHFRRYLDVSVGCWIYMKAYILEKVFGINVRIFGHQEKFMDKSLIILNHRCHFDWLFFWIVVGKMGDSSKWQVMLKRIGKIAPFFGWTMQARNHFFLSRKWEVDEIEFKWKLNYLEATRSDYQLLMFPEGTDFNPKSKAISDAFADTNSLPKYEYVLNPKSTGFVYTLKKLRQYKIDAVYDITVGYPDILAKTEVDMLKNGKIPREIHYHVTKYDTAALPEEDDDIEQWLRARWNEKEERLKSFYVHREFRNLPADEEVANHSCTVSNTNDVSNGHSSLEQSSSSEVFGDMNFFRFFLSQLFYTAQGSFFLFLCSLSWYYVLWGVVAACWLQYVSLKTPGLDYMIMRHLKDPDFIKKVNKNPT